MKFVIDQQLPPALINWLAQRGHDAEHVRNIGMRDADDDVIWRWAERESAAVITKDEDFAARRSRVSAGPTIVWLRIGNATTPLLLAWLDAAWPDVETELKAGVALIEVR